MSSNRQRAQTLIAQVRSDLLKRIRSGEFAVGEKIPSLVALRSEYEASEGTVHAAIRELQHAGVVESVTGRGTFVARMPDADNEPADPAVAELREEIAELRDRLEALERAIGTASG